MAKLKFTPDLIFRGEFLVCKADPPITSYLLPRFSGEEKWWDSCNIKNTKRRFEFVMFQFSLRENAAYGKIVL